MRSSPGQSDSASVGRSSQEASLTTDPPMRKVVGFFAATNLVASGLRLFGALLTSRFVDPSVLGQYNGIGLVQGYAPFLQIGISNGLMRDLPFYLGRGENERAEQLVAAAQWWALFVSGVAASVLAAIGLYNAIAGRWDLAIGWWSFIGVVFFALFGQQFLRALFRTGGDFIRLANIQLATGVAALLLVSLVWWFGWWGLCFRGLGVACLGAVLMWRWRPMRTGPRLDVRALLTLGRTGIPIFLAGNFLMWWSTLNATLVLRYAGTTGLGLYAIANMAGPVLFLLPQALNSVIYPRMAATFGQTGKVLDLLVLAAKPMLVTIFATWVAVVCAWVAMPAAVSLLLPKYVDGIPAAQWAVVAVGPMALGTVNSVFPVVQRLGRYGAAIAGGMLAYLFAIWMFLADGVQLVDFPQALLVGRLVFMVLCYGMIAQLVLVERRLERSTGAGTSE